MTTTTSPHDQAPVWAATSEIPVQRTVVPARAVSAHLVTKPVVTTPARVSAARPRPVLPVMEKLARVRPVVARPVPVPPAVAPQVQQVPAQRQWVQVPEQPEPARAAPVRLPRVRTQPVRTQPVRRRWPAALGGLAAGLTLGAVGAVGAVVALSATAATLPAPAPTVVAAPAESLSPNVSVPGRVLTAVDDGTWQVGVDVAPGTYATTGAVDGPTCRHALSTARTGGTISAGAAATGPATVVLTADDGWFATFGCATWTRVG